MAVVYHQCILSLHLQENGKLQQSLCHVTCSSRTFNVHLGHYTATWIYIWSRDCIWCKWCMHHHSTGFLNAFFALKITYGLKVHT